MSIQQIARRGERALWLMRIRTAIPRQMYWRYAMKVLLDGRR